jgi:hypothetical protein
MWHDIHTKFHKDWYRHSSNIMVLPQKYEAVMLVLRTGFMNYAVEMSSGALISLSLSLSHTHTHTHTSFIKIGSVNGAGYTHTQQR